MRTSTARGLVALAGLLLASSTQARPLELYELYDLEQYLGCAYDTCRDPCAPSRTTPWNATYEQFVACETCLDDNGCDEPPRLWEKDGAPPITRNDYDLAILEQLHPEDVCYADVEKTIVRPMALCPGTACQAEIQACIDDPTAGCAPTGAAILCKDETFGPTCWYDQTPRTGCPAFICSATVAELAVMSATALCADADKDGLPAWAEAELGAGGAVCDPTQADPCPAGWACVHGEYREWECQKKACDAATPCGFFEECRQEPGQALATCRERTVCNGASAATLPTTNDITPVGQICDPRTGACVACAYNEHCASGERCTASGACEKASICTTSLDCVADGQVCDTAAGYCVQCLTSAECTEGDVCSVNGVCRPGCDSDLLCTGAGELCDIAAGHCVECVDDSACNFASVCVRGACRPRQCTDGELCQKLPPSQAADEALCPDLNCHANLASSTPNCTAFHLEKVAEDDIEVLVHVHYDYTPIPARVLDLYLNYDATQLTLQDARPLPGLKLAGKRLGSSHLSDGTLLINVFDDNGTHPVPKGPIVELVFRRVGSCATEIKFTDRLDLLPLTVAPKQGSDAVQAELRNPLLWGAPIRLCARSQITPKLKLWYGFETLTDPLAYSRIPSADDICARIPDCVHEPDPEIRARYVAALRVMQRGQELVSDSTGGVTGGGVYLDGAADHLRLPMHYEEPLTAGAQSFSFSTWYYTEGNSETELPETPQILYSHNAFNERTVFGLMSMETGGDLSGLLFFVGDVLDPRLSGHEVLKSALVLPEGECAQVNALNDAPAFWVAPSVGLRTWHHVAFTMDADYDVAPNADDAKFTFYVDGKNVGCVVVEQPPDAVQCPQFFAGTDVGVHDEGDVLGGRPPEYLYVGVRRSNLMKIERMDPAGLQSVPIIGDTEFNYQDPDYSPILDKLVYSSDASGNMEIWIADGDGSNRKQITSGFGDSFRGITARRPRWAPDGSAIVFDSDIYDVLAGDNSYARVRHIYYVEYDPIGNHVAVRLADNSTTEQLEYLARLQDQTISDYRLTTALDRHHKGARWLTGRNANAPGRERGALLIDTSKDDFSAHRVRLLTIPDAYPLAKTEAVNGLGTADDLRLLDAHHSEKAAFPATIVTERALVSREDLLWEHESLQPSPQFHVECKGTGGAQGVCKPAGDHTELVLVHTPNGYDDRCWDSNFNGVADSDEDRNADGVWDKKDCTPYEMDVYVSYDSNRFTPVLDLQPRCTADRDCDGGYVCKSERCELADRTQLRTCSGVLLCDPGTYCDHSVLHCKGLVQTVLPCATASDCFTSFASESLTQVCDHNQCKAAGDKPVVCLADSDCQGDWICSEGACIPAAGAVECTKAQPCTGGQVCAPKPLTSADKGHCALPAPKYCGGDGAGGTITCRQEERCEGNQCKALGRQSVTDGVVTIMRSKGCVVDVDCDGGQVCLTGECTVVTKARTCTSNAGCEGGSVCVTSAGLCRPADKAMLLCPKTGPCASGTSGCGCTKAEGAACDLDSECVGGQVCYAPTGHCREATGPAMLSTTGDAVFGVFGKKLRLSTRFTDVGGTATSLVRVQLTSPQSAKPVGAGEIARIVFVEKGTGAGAAFTPDVFRQFIHSELVVKDLTKPGLPTVFDPAGLFDMVVDGAFSPSGDRIMLGAITNARPILLRTQGLTSALDAERITVNPVRTQGIRWVRQGQFYACNWVGGYVHLQSKNVMHGFRGGLDDLKIHSGLRDPDALRSEAERGREFLVQNGADGKVTSNLPTCGSSHSECPAFHVCIDSECQMVPCDPADPWSCAKIGARCTLRPESVEQENPNASGSTAGWDWVCAADCSTDNQCFTQVCLNGPCRFCDTGTLTCIECRESVQQLGAIQIAGIEGCPDQRSFDCQAGACVTDCYAFEDGKSIYLCDPTTEFCDRGKCVLLDWDWWDLAPATLAGLGEVRRKVAPDPSNSWYGYTQAVDQRIPITIVAYGVEDWLHSPEMVVEVSGGPFYGDAWQRIAKVHVHHRTAVEAANEPYVVTSPRPFNNMRLRLVTSPYANLHGTATGLRENDKHFCIADYLAAVKGATEGDAALACSRSAQGSGYTIGFASNVTTQQMIADCKARGHTGCPTTLLGEADFLRPGSNAVVVLDAFVDGGSVTNNITHNRVCSYQGGESALTPIDNGVDSKVVYGRFGDERSNQADAIRAACQPSKVPKDFTALWTGDGTTNVSVGSTGQAVGNGVAHGVGTAPGRVKEAMAFDEPSDYLSVPPGVVSGSDGFTVEGWVRTGDVDGAIVSIFARPASCQEWQDRGRSTDGQYTIWPDVRAIPVYCANMGDPTVAPTTYLTLERTEGLANTSRYAAGKGSYGTPVRTAYTKLRFDPATMSVDLSDQAFASNNGGRLGHRCGAPADPNDPTALGCLRENGGLRHLWRGEYDVYDTSEAKMSRSQGVAFTTGRIGQALDFQGAGGRIVSNEGLPATGRLSAEAWVRVTSEAPMVIVRQGAAPMPGAWALGLDAGRLRFTLSGAVDAHGNVAELKASAADAVNDGAWHHVAVTVDAHGVSTQVWLYVDGQEVANNRLFLGGVPTFWDAPELAVGEPVVVAQGPHDAEGFRGALDDVGVWSLTLPDTAVLRLFELADPQTTQPGQGGGKCLPEEVDDLPVCSADQMVTTLPLGVAYGCLGDQAVESTLDLRGTPFAFDGAATDQFGPHGDEAVGSARYSEGTSQLIRLAGGGNCGGYGPVAWSGDPTETPPQGPLWVPVRLLDTVSATPGDCAGDAACVSRSVDEVLTLNLTAGGFETRSGGQVHHSASGKKRLSDFVWHHVAAVREDSSLTVWVDGQIWLATNDVPNLTASDIAGIDRIVVGQSPECAFAPEACEDRTVTFRGRIDELAFYHRPLEALEIGTIVSAGAHGRPVDGRPAPECPSDDDTLVEFNPKLRGKALLNCNYVDANPTGESAGIEYKNIVVLRQWPAMKDAIVHDDGDTCLVEVTPTLVEPCYEWTGADVGVDGSNGLISFGSYVPFQTLEVSLPRSFGHDEGFETLPQPTFPLRLQVGGLSDAKVTVDWDPRSTANPATMGNGTLTLADLMFGREFNARVAKQPAGWSCRFQNGLGPDALCGTCVSGTMGSAAKVINLDCLRIRKVQVAVAFVDKLGAPLANPVLGSDLVLSVSAPASGDVDTMRVRPADAVAGAPQQKTLTGLRPVDGDSLFLEFVEQPGGFSCSTPTSTVSNVSGTTVFAVTCQKATDYPVTFEVSGLGSGKDFGCAGSSATGAKLQLTAGGTTETLCIGGDGQGASTIQVIPGVGWEMSITQQPIAPPVRHCSITANATGVMVAGGLKTSLRPKITCVAPTNVVSGHVIGLKNSDLKLGLVTVGTAPGGGDQTVSSITVKPSTAIGPPPVDYAFTEMPLMDGVTFRVVVQSGPAGYSCVPQPAEMTTPIAKGQIVLVSCTVIPAPVYHLSGQITGLTSDNLKLAVGLGAEKINIAAGATSFAFAMAFSDKMEWQIDIDKQPDGQFCTVTPGKGKIAAADVKNVKVDCQNLTVVKVVAKAPSGYGSARVKAFLVRTGAKSVLAGRILGDEDSPTVSGGQVTFEMVGVAPTSSLADTPTGPGNDSVVTFGPMLAGNYTLFVMLSKTVSSATGEVTFPAGTTQGAWTSFAINNPLPKQVVVDISASEFLATREGVVVAAPVVPLLPTNKGDEMVCAWSPHLASPPSPPFKGLAPVIGFSRFQCEGNNGCKLITNAEWLALLTSGDPIDPAGPDLMGNVVTVTHDPLPNLATLDVTCWADADDDNKNGDFDVLSTGDHYGRLEDIPSGPALVPLFTFKE